LQSPIEGIVIRLTLLLPKDIEGKFKQEARNPKGIIGILYMWVNARKTE